MNQIWSVLVHSQFLLSHCSLMELVFFEVGFVSNNKRVSTYFIRSNMKRVNVCTACHEAEYKRWKMHSSLYANKEMLQPSLHLSELTAWYTQQGISWESRTSRTSTTAIERLQFVHLAWQKLSVVRDYCTTSQVRKWVLGLTSFAVSHILQLVSVICQRHNAKKHWIISLFKTF